MHSPVILTLTTDACPLFSPIRVVRERPVKNCADWGRVVFNDESRYKLFPDGNCRRVSRRPGQCGGHALTLASHTGSQQGIMALSVISFGWKTNPLVISGTATAHHYNYDILESTMLRFVNIAFIHLLRHRGISFQHDNVCPHTACNIMICLQACPILPWPACLPDFCTIEDIWDVMRRKL